MNMKYKNLLISPPIFDYYSTPARMESLGLNYIKKALMSFQVLEQIYTTQSIPAKKSLQKSRMSFHILMKFTGNIIQYFHSSINFFFKESPLLKQKRFHNPMPLRDRFHFVRATNQLNS